MAVRLTCVRIRFDAACVALFVFCFLFPFVTDVRHGALFTTLCFVTRRVNIKLSREDQQLISGEHGDFDTVAEVRCKGCDVEIGRKYVRVQARLFAFPFDARIRVGFAACEEEINLIVHACVCIAYVHGNCFDVFNANIVEGVDGGQVQKEQSTTCMLMSNNEF